MMRFLRFLRDVRDSATLGWAIVLGRLGFEYRSLCVVRRLMDRIALRAIAEPEKPRIVGLDWEVK